jgi:hypothetical protein
MIWLHLPLEANKETTISISTARKAHQRTLSREEGICTSAKSHWEEKGCKKEGPSR